MHPLSTCRVFQRRSIGWPFLIVLLAGLSSPAAASSQHTRASAPDESVTHRLDIAAGPLANTIAALEAATGLSIRDASLVASVPDAVSPGVTGDYTVEAALAKVLEGTPFVHRRTAPGEYSIDLRIAPERVEVAGVAAPYRREHSSSTTRTPTALRDIPQTVSIVTRELLNDQRAQSVADAMRNVPGVSIAQGEGNRDQVVLRGINTTSDFFVNGVRDDQERFRDLYNVDTLEVVQGPAAVLFGRGGAGGVVNVVTRRAARGAPSDASMEVGPYGHSRATARLTVPAGDAAAFGLSTMAQRSGGFRDGAFLHRYGVNPTFSAPLGSSARLSLGGEYMSDRRLADRGIPSRAGAPVIVSPRQFFGSLEQNEAQSGVRSGHATLEARVGSRLLVRNTFLAGQYPKAYRNVYPGSAVSATGTFTLAAYRQETNRTNLFNQTDVIYDMRVGSTHHTLLAGIEAGHQVQQEQRLVAPPIPNVLLTSSARDADFGAAVLATDRDAASDVLGAYVQDQVALSRRWKAVVGARLDRFGVRVDDHMAGSTNLSRTDVVLSPRAGLIYQPVPQVSLYGLYSYAFLPSGATLGLAVNTAELGPENAINYETGAKLELFGAKLMVTAAAFRLNRNNVKNTDPDNPTRLVLTGQQQTEGFVLSASGSITPAWKLHAGYADLDARITRDTAAAPAGRTVGLVPRRQGSIWSTFEFARRLGVGGGIVDQSSEFASFSNLVRLPGFTRLDGLVYYQLGRYRLAVNAENLLNRRYYPTAHNDNNISPGAPRNINMSLRAIF